MNFKQLERNRVIFILHRNSWPPYRIKRFFELYGEILTGNYIRSTINSHKRSDVKYQKSMDETTTNEEVETETEETEGEEQTEEAPQSE